MKYLIKPFFVSIIMLMTVLPMTTHLLRTIKGKTGLSLNENRYLTPWPKWNGADNNPATYTKELEKYVNDNFGFRAEVIRIYNAIAIRLSHTGSVIKGNSSGWYFLNARQIWLSYKGNTGFSEASIENWMQSLTALKKVSEANGAKFAAIIPPNKARIYSEFVPKRYKTASPRRFVDALYAYPHAQELGLRNIEPMLMEKKKDSPIYYKTDTHWTATGAYEGYVAVMAVLNEKGAKFPVLEKKQIKLGKLKEHSGDLAALMGQKDIVTEAISVLNAPPPKMKIITTQLQDNAFTSGWKAYEYTNGNLNGDTLVIIGDSFVAHTIQFFYHSFDRIIYLLDAKGGIEIELDLQFIRDLKPSAVVYLNVERNAERWQGYVH